MCTGGKALISLFRNPAPGETGTVGVSQNKKLETIKFARQYRISHCKRQSIGSSVLDIYYVFISIVQKFALSLHLTPRPAEPVRPLRPWSDQKSCHLRSKPCNFSVLVGPIIVRLRSFSNGRTNLGLLPPPLNSMYNSSYINAVQEPSAQRRRTKGEPQSCI